MEGGAVVSEDYGPRGNEFTGGVNWVQIDLDAADDDLGHLITPEERLHIAMASTGARRRLSGMRAAGRGRGRSSFASYVRRSTLMARRSSMAR
jgi:hypothetical protein